MAAPLNAHLTELDAVNKILSSIGEDSISTLLIADDLADAASALGKLREISRQVQAGGWHCNSQQDVTLSINGNNEFTVPVNTLKVDSTGVDKWTNVSMRRNTADTSFVLYDHEENALTWSSRTTMLVDITYYLPFGQLTPMLQHYIMYRAGHEFQKTSLGSVVLWEFTKEDVAVSLAEAEAEESENEDTNVLRQSPSVRAIAARRNWRWGQ